MTRARAILAGATHTADWWCSRVEADMDRWQHFASDAVNAYWPWITTVADALVAKKVVFGFELGSLRRSRRSRNL